MRSLWMVFFFLRFGCLYSEIIDLKGYEKSLLSEHGEDGVIQQIFQLIGVDSAYYVEFGAGDGHLWSNTKYLREKHQWGGLLLEGNCSDDLKINLHQEFITAENICDLFAKYEVPSEFDLLSIDIDRNDFYVWKAISEKYSPRVVVIECNPHISCRSDRVIRYDPFAVWDGSAYRGASTLALYRLGRHLGYSFVYQESVGTNTFFIRDDCLQKTCLQFKNMNQPHKLCTARFRHQKLRNLNQFFISAADILKEDSR